MVQAKKTREAVVCGVESSCDETAVGIVRVSWDESASSGGQPQITVLANAVASSMDEHARFGGVVPEIASRAHLESIVPVMHEALHQAKKQGVSVEDISAVAATVGPGLAGALLVGASAAKAYAAGWGVPFYGVNHLAGHVSVAALEGEPLPHAIALLVSGGHTQILEVNGWEHPLRELGSTLDDAAGEAYDKVARLLRLGYPGGPIIDRLAAAGNPSAIHFPRALMKKHPQGSDVSYDFSFSGLKTAVARYVEAAEASGEVIDVADVCASFQEAVCDVLSAKTVNACVATGARVVLLGGGVAANRRLRELLGRRCQSQGIELRVPPLGYCTDNGVMIATIAALRIAAGVAPSSLAVGTDPSLDVEVTQL